MPRTSGRTPPLTRHKWPQLQEQSQTASHSSVLNTTIVAALVIAAIACGGIGMGMAFGILGAILGWTLLSTGVVLAAAAVAVKAFASQRGTKRMQQLAIEATNLDLALFDNRVSNIRLMAGRNVINQMAERLDRLHDSLNTATTKAQEMAVDAGSRFTGMAGDSVPLEVPGIVLPTNSDIEAVMVKMFTPRMEGIVGPIIPTCVLDADAMVAQINRCVRAEITSLKLDDVAVIDFVEHWPNAIESKGSQWSVSMSRGPAAPSTRRRSRDIRPRFFGSFAPAAGAAIPGRWWNFSARGRSRTSTRCAIRISAIPGASSFPTSGGGFPSDRSRISPSWSAKRKAWRRRWSRSW